MVLFLAAVVPQDPLPGQRGAAARHARPLERRNSQEQAQLAQQAQQGATPPERKRKRPPLAPPRGAAVVRASPGADGAGRRRVGVVFSERDNSWTAAAACRDGNGQIVPVSL
jgi:hypothetical protein